LVISLVLPAHASQSDAISEDVPIVGGVDALARSLRLESLDRARCLTELIRIGYSDGHARQDADSILQRTLAHFTATRADGGREIAADRVPIPLTTAIWSDVVFRRPLRPADVVPAIIGDRQAALLAYGLSALDDDTLRFVALRPSLIARLYARDAAVFATLAAHLRIVGGQVVPRGGETAARVWEAVVGVPASDAQRFIQTLYSRDEGRLAYLYDLVEQLDPAQAAFVLGLWIDDPVLRIDRFRALVAIARETSGEWDLRKAPFSRPAHDLLLLFLRVAADATGRPSPPADRGVWARAFGLEDSAEPSMPSPAVDAAWLADAVIDQSPPIRATRLDQLAFGMRVFSTTPASARQDVSVALEAYPRVPALMLELERIGIVAPATYVALAQHAQQLARVQNDQRPVVLSQFQSVVTLIARMTRARTIGRVDAERLLLDLSANPIDSDVGYTCSVADWIDSRLLPALPAGATREATLVAALAGPPQPASLEAISWEGHQYRFDGAASATRRMLEIRSRQGGPTLDEILARRPVSRTRRACEDSDARVAETLRGLAYAAVLSDFQGTSRVPAGVARRHVFESRRSKGSAFRLPRRTIETDQPWHVEGAILGLDVAMASLAPQPIDDGRSPIEPRLGGNLRELFLISQATLNPATLTDRDATAIAAAITHGRERIAAIGNEAHALSIAYAIGLDGWRRRALRWTIRHEPQQPDRLFTMTELLELGGMRLADLDGWGMSALPLYGCLCTRLLPSRINAALAGRPQFGVLGSTAADLHLRIAVVLVELKLPASLAKPIVAAALQDFVNRVAPSDFDDWLTLARSARALSRERIEDYVAAAVSSERLVPLAAARPF
jgi:hypothetical protein